MVTSERVGADYANPGAGSCSRTALSGTTSPSLTVSALPQGQRSRAPRTLDGPKAIWTYGRDFVEAAASGSRSSAVRRRVQPGSDMLTRCVKNSKRIPVLLGTSHRFGQADQYRSVTHTRKSKMVPRDAARRMQYARVQPRQHQHHRRLIQSNPNHRRTPNHTDILRRYRRPPSRPSASRYQHRLPCRQPLLRNRVMPPRIRAPPHTLLPHPQPP